MGQMTVGVLYGIPAPPEVDEFGRPLIDRLLKRCLSEFENTIDAYTKSRGGYVPGREYRFVPVSVHTPDLHLIGFWVAVAGEARDDCDCLDKPGVLHEIDQYGPYTHAYMKAHVRWKHFAQWAERQGYKFTDAKLWVTPLEVA